MFNKIFSSRNNNVQIAPEKMLIRVKTKLFLQFLKSLINVFMLPLTNSGLHDIPVFVNKR